MKFFNRHARLLSLPYRCYLEMVMRLCLHTMKTTTVQQKWMLNTNTSVTKSLNFSWVPKIIEGGTTTLLGNYHTNYQILEVCITAFEALCSNQCLSLFISQFANNKKHEILWISFCSSCSQCTHQTRAKCSNQCYLIRYQRYVAPYEVLCGGRLSQDAILGCIHTIYPLCYTFIYIV